MKTGDETGWLTAADCASRVGLTVRALRVYERHGLVAPRRSEKGWRLYGREQIARLHEILALKRLGLSLAQIAGLLRGQRADISRTLGMQRAALSELKIRAEQGLALLDAAQARLTAGETLQLADLITLITETNMEMQDAGSVLKPFYDRHITEDDRLRRREILGKRWRALHGELRQFVKDGADPTSPEAFAFMRRWIACSNLTQGNVRAWRTRVSVIEITPVAQEDVLSIR